MSWGATGAEDLLESLVLAEALVASAAWLDGLGDFELHLADGRRVVFRDCLQVGFHRPLGFEREPPRITAWWTDEPSPVLQSLGPEVRFRYQHLVMEIGLAVLRVACRSVELGAAP